MPLTPEALTRKIKDILRHSQPLPDEAKAPILHCRRTSADIWGSLGYVERLVADRTPLDRGKLHAHTVFRME